MESIITKIRALYKELGPAEKRVADYILENTREIPTSAISELAKKCSCGDATLVRFSRRLGFDGFQGLKIRLATELGAYSTVSHEINKNDKLKKKNILLSILIPTLMHGIYDYCLFTGNVLFTII